MVYVYVTTTKSKIGNQKALVRDSKAGDVSYLYNDMSSLDGGKYFVVVESDFSAGDGGSSSST